MNLINLSVTFKTQASSFNSRIKISFSSAWFLSFLLSSLTLILAFASSGDLGPIFSLLYQIVP